MGGRDSGAASFAGSRTTPGQRKRSVTSMRAAGPACDAACCARWVSDASRSASISNVAADAVGRKCSDPSTLPRRTEPAMVWRNSDSAARKSSGNLHPISRKR
jgi:hypothetical protein